MCVSPFFTYPQKCGRNSDHSSLLSGFLTLPLCSPVQDVFNVLVFPTGYGWTAWLLWALDRQWLWEGPQQSQTSLHHLQQPPAVSQRGFYTGCHGSLGSGRCPWECRGRWNCELNLWNCVLVGTEDVNAKLTVAVSCLNTVSPFLWIFSLAGPVVPCVL